MIGAVSELAIPERARRERLPPRRRDLPVKPRIGLKEALVGRLAVEDHLAVRPDLGRDEQRLQDIFELIVEIARHRAGQHAVERQPAAGEQQQDPRRRDQNHPPRQRSVAANRAKSFLYVGGHRWARIRANRPSASASGLHSALLVTPALSRGPSSRTRHGRALLPCASLPMDPGSRPGGRRAGHGARAPAPRGPRAGGGGDGGGAAGWPNANSS